MELHFLILLQNFLLRVFLLLGQEKKIKTRKLAKNLEDEDIRVNKLAAANSVLTLYFIL